jgi:formylmethanofuran dehydrogenase subunit C
MPMILKLKDDPAEPAVPIDASCICPDRIAGLESPDVERLPILVGRSPVSLGEFFHVKATAWRRSRWKGISLRSHASGPR